MAGDPKTLYCSFCGKSQQEVATLIAGPTAFICGECIYFYADTYRLDHLQNTERLAEAAASEWLERIGDLRRIIALRSSDEHWIDPIRGPWLMHAARDPDGSVSIKVERRSKGAGDLSIIFTETPDDLLDIAELVATAEAGGLRSPPAQKTRVVEGVAMSLWISGRALLYEFERIAEGLKLKDFLHSTPAKTEPPLPPGIDDIRRGIDSLIEHNPEYRATIADMLRHALNKLATGGKGDR
jgi:ClpX C4-type zinc finger